MRAVYWSTESDIPYQWLASKIEPDSPITGSWRERGKRSRATDLFGGKKLAIFLVVFSNANHCHVLELGDLYAALA